MGSTLFLVVVFLILALMIVSMWKVFEKAGQPGWAAIVPIYNMYVMVTAVAEMEILWFILCFVPLLNYVAIFVIYINVAKKFGQGALFGVGMVLLPFICWPVLAFGDAEHESQSRRGRRRSRSRDYSDYEDDEDDRPRKKRRDEDDEEEEERPSKRRRVVDEDEVEERPSKRRRNDEEEEERPSKRRRDDDEDDRPRRRRRDDD